MRLVSDPRKNLTLFSNKIIRSDTPMLVDIGNDTKKSLQTIVRYVWIYREEDGGCGHQRPLLGSHF